MLDSEEGFSTRACVRAHVDYAMRIYEEEWNRVVLPAWNHWKTMRASIDVLTAGAERYDIGGAE